MIDIPDSIFPKNDKGEALCFKCQHTVAACKCKPYDPNAPKVDQFNPKVSIDRKGRKGKVVVLVAGLPQDKGFLKDLAKKLKNKTGSGGTFYVKQQEGIIEIQGQNKFAVEEVLKSEGFTI